MPLHSRPSSARWLVCAASRDLWNRHKENYRSLDKHVRHRFQVRLASAFLVALLACTALTLLGKNLAGCGLARWDSTVLTRITEEYPLFTFYNATIFESFGNLAMTVPIVVLTAVVLTRRGHPLPALAFVIGYIGLRPLIYCGWWIWNRARPELVADGIASPPVHSYPSGHAVISLFVYGFLARLWWQASNSRLERATIVIVTVLLLFLIGWARLRLGTHWPSDVLAGFVIGAVWLGGVLRAVAAGTPEPSPAEKSPAAGQNP